MKMSAKLKNNSVTIGLLALGLAFGLWGYSLGEPEVSMKHLTEEVMVLGVLGALAIAMMAGMGVKGQPTALINLNRIIAWPMAFGYVWVHYAYHMEHGQPGGLLALDVVPRVFFLVSFVWIAFHAGVAFRIYGAPWKLRVKSLHDFYVASSWLVLLVTIPVFSVPAMGASPVLMAIAWAIFAPHLSINVFNMSKRVPIAVISNGIGPWIISAIYLVAIGFAAIHSFPKF